MNVQIVSLDKPSCPALKISEKVKVQILYLTTNAPADLQSESSPNEYWFNLGLAKQILDDGVFLVVSPLRAENAAEVELSEESEELLEWILANSIQHVRIEKCQ